jgi:hypothetical protein
VPAFFEKGGKLMAANKNNYMSIVRVFPAEKQQPMGGCVVGPDHARLLCYPYLEGINELEKSTQEKVTLGMVGV